jgi:hypothetical protein
MDFNDLIKSVNVSNIINRIIYSLEMYLLTEEDPHVEISISNAINDVYQSQKL